MANPMNGFSSMPSGDQPDSIAIDEQLAKKAQHIIQKILRGAGITEALRADLWTQAMEESNNLTTLPLPRLAKKLQEIRVPDNIDYFKTEATIEMLGIALRYEEKVRLQQSKAS